MVRQHFIGGFAVRSHDSSAGHFLLLRVENHVIAFLLKSFAFRIFGSVQPPFLPKGAELIAFAKVSGPVFFF